jgi:hypothetical protein
VLGRQQRLGDLLTVPQHDRDGRRAHARRLATAVALAALTAVLAGCGGASGSAPSTVAQAVAPSALPDTTTSDGVPASHAIEPPAGGSVTTPAVAAQPSDDENASAATGAPQRASVPAASSGAILSAVDRVSFARLAASLGGDSGLAVSPLGFGHRVERVGSLRSAVAWSTSKVPVAMAVIAAGGGSSQQANLRQAITASDNAAAERLWASLGSGQAAASAADEQLRASGDEHTVVEYRSLRGAGYTPFGQTSWALTDQVRFTAGLACSDAGRQVLTLMSQVVAGQRWGLGSAGVSAQLKGGWGPGSTPGASGGYLDRQMGILTIHGKPLAVSIATRPADGSHESGTRSLTALARWLVAHANTNGVHAIPEC